MRRDAGQSNKQIASTKKQLAGDLAHLQKLWSRLEQTNIIIERAAIAYLESRTLLARIDGVALSTSGPRSDSITLARDRPPHVWMAPLVQELFCVNGRGRLRSCVRPVCAVVHKPLALMDSAGRGLISWSGFKSP